MGRSRKCRGGAGSNDNNIQNTRLTDNQRQHLPRPIPSAPPYEPTPSAPPYEPPPYESRDLPPFASGPIPSAPPYEPPYEPPFASISRPIPSAPPYEPTPSAPPYEPPPFPSGPLLSPEAIIEREKPTCGSFTARIPGIRSTLTWVQLRDLCTTQLTEAELAGVTDPHELYRSLVGADGNRLLEALRSTLNPTDLLPVERTNEIQGLLSGWMDVRRGLGLPPILGLDGIEITVDRLNPLSCRITADRPDLAEYSDTWLVIASFVQARPDIFKAVFAEALIPSAIAGGSEGGLPCLEGFCHYALLKMRDAVTTCFAREDRELPTVLPPMTGVLKMRRGRTTVSAFLERVTPIPGEESIVLESHRDRIMGILQRTYPGVDWTHDDITTIFNELRTVYRESYRGGKTRRKRKRRTRRSRFQLNKL